jgi:hypothetical protein
LHWNNDDTEQQPMALKGNSTADALVFWDSVSATFGSNKMVFYELYNEPHLNDVTAYIHGNAQYAGMLELAAAVRKNAPDAMLIVAGAKSYAYDAESLVSLDAEFLKQGETNVMWNFHPYMGPNQAGDQTKCAAGFEALLEVVEKNTTKPSIITEFGQSCCGTDAPCEQCPGTYHGVAMGYDEMIIQIAEKHGVSWLPWAWIPGASSSDGDGKLCLNANAGNANGTVLAGSVNGEGADFAKLWSAYASKP